MRDQGDLGSGILRPVDVDRGVSALEDDQFLAVSADLLQAERVLIELPGGFPILDRDVRDCVYMVQHISSSPDVQRFEFGANVLLRRHDFSMRTRTARSDLY